MSDLFIKREANMSHDGKIRWSLARWLHFIDRSKFIAILMNNPSNANDQIDDPTIKRCIHFAHLWGYDGLVVVNKYPYVTPYPNVCKKWADWDKPNNPDWAVRDILQKNLTVIENMGRNASLRLAAFGNIQNDEDWTNLCLEAFNQGGKLHCLGITKNGSPKHPMARGKHRIPDDQKPLLWLKQEVN